MDIIILLDQVPLFHGLSKRHLGYLSDIAQTQDCEKGKIIFSEGDEATGFYIVASGRVKIFKLSFDGKEQILHIFGPGEPFGEVAVFAGLNFPANAMTMEKTQLIFFPKHAFVDLIKKDPTLSLNMLAVLSLRLRKFTRLVENLSLKEVPGRLAAYLLFLREKNQGRDAFCLDIPKGQLAGVLGTIPETLSRVLTKMNQKGIIQTRGPEIRILDLPRLENMAETGERL